MSQTSRCPLAPEPQEAGFIICTREVCPRACARRAEDWLHLEPHRFSKGSGTQNVVQTPDLVSPTDCRTQGRGHFSHKGVPPRKHNQGSIMELPPGADDRNLLVYVKLWIPTLLLYLCHLNLGFVSAAWSTW